MIVDCHSPEWPCYCLQLIRTQHSVPKERFFPSLVLYDLDPASFSLACPTRGMERGGNLWK
jgi:hypothetical protein